MQCALHAIHHSAVLQSASIASATYHIVTAACSCAQLPLLMHRHSHHHIPDALHHKASEHHMCVCDTSPGDHLAASSALCHSFWRWWCSGPVLFLLLSMNSIMIRVPMYVCCTLPVRHAMVCEACACMQLELSCSSSSSSSRCIGHAAGGRSAPEAQPCNAVAAGPVKQAGTSRAGQRDGAWIRSSVHCMPCWARVQRMHGFVHGPLMATDEAS
jgi:hypothetical protein